MPGETVWPDLVGQRRVVHRRPSRGVDEQCWPVCRPGSETSRRSRVERNHPDRHTLLTWECPGPPSTATSSGSPFRRSRRWWPSRSSCSPDSAIVGHLGTLQLAALGIAGSVLATVVRLCVFLVYARLRRSRAAWAPPTLARGAFAAGIDGLWLALLLGLLIAVLGQPLTPRVLEAFGTPDGVAPYAETHLRVSLLGVPSMLLVLAGTGVLRGVQDTRTPLVVAGVAAAVNVALNVVLVFGLGIGIAGAAWGTVLAGAARGVNVRTSSGAPAARACCSRRTPPWGSARAARGPPHRLHGHHVPRLRPRRARDRRPGAGGAQSRQRGRGGRARFDSAASGVGHARRRGPRCGRSGGAAAVRVAVHARRCGAARAERRPRGRRGTAARGRSGVRARWGAHPCRRGPLPRGRRSADARRVRTGRAARRLAGRAVVGLRGVHACAARDARDPAVTDAWLVTAATLV